MQVDHLLVDEIILDSASISGVAKSTLYDFRQSQWVSAHRERDGHTLGPITILRENEGAENDWMNISARSFGERKLSTQGTPAKPIISFTDTWTIPDLTLYTLVLPKFFIPTEMSITREGADWHPTIETGMSPSQQIFYYALFADWRSQMHVFRVEARLEPNERRYEELANAVGTVNGTDGFQHLRNAVGGQVSTPDFWFKLLELGTKLFGH